MKAHSVEPPKDPSSFSWLTYAWVIGVSSLGGIASFAKKIKAGKVRAFNIVELLGELFISAFVGIITFWICNAAEIAPLWTAAFVGICGHMGSRALFMFEKWVEKKIPMPKE